MAGFYKSNYVDVNGVKKICASTQFEALDARRYGDNVYGVLLGIDGYGWVYA